MNLEPVVTFYILAYNAENYIRQTMNSVLNQTEKNIAVVVRNNGSTDHTGNILRQYAKKDKRVTLLENKVNMILDNQQEIQKYGPYLLPGYLPGEYVCTLDSDDFVSKDYAKKLYTAAKKIDADIAVCGSHFFEDGTNRLIGSRIPPSVNTNDMRQIAAAFPALYPCFRPVWGKIIKGSFYREHFDFAFSMHSGNGNDTNMALGYLMKCRSIVSLEEPLHFYRVRKKSAFHTAIVDFARIQVGAKLFQRGMDCIQALHIDTPKNIDYLRQVHIGHMYDLLNLVKQSSEMTVREKVEFVEKVLNDPQLNATISSGRHLAEHLNSLICDALQTAFADNKERVFEFYDSFAVRWYLGETLTKENSPLRQLALLSAVMDEKNKYHFGVYQLPDWFEAHPFAQNLEQQLPNIIKLPYEQRISALESVFHQEDTEKQMVQFLINHINQGNVSKAAEYLNFLSGVNVLNRESIFFRIYLSWQIGECNTAVLLAHAATILYPDDEDIQKICQDVISEGKKGGIPIA